MKRPPEKPVAHGDEKEGKRTAADHTWNCHEFASPVRRDPTIYPAEEPARDRYIGTVSQIQSSFIVDQIEFGID